VERALKWVIANKSKYGIDAINMSLSTDYNVVKDELATLWNGGVFIGASSGNGYNSNNWFAMPAGSPYAMSVGAENQNQTVANITSRGSALDIVAPGSQVPYLDMSGTYWPGGTATSYSAPFGSAAGAVIKQVVPHFSNDQIVAILKDSGHLAYDPVYKVNYKGLDMDSAIALAYARSGQTAAAPAPAPSPTPTPTPTPVTTTSTRSAFSAIMGTTFNLQSGGVTKGSGFITSLDSNDWVGYKGVNFGGGASKFITSMAVNNANAGRAIFITLGGPLGKGKLIGTLKTLGTGGTQYYKQQSVMITRTSGVHDVYLTFGGGSAAGNLGWFKFG
jgi:hypothetical protein